MTVPETRRLTGAALYARVAADLRAGLARDYGLPMSEYAHEVLDVHSLGSDMQPVLAIRFTRPDGHAFTISDIYPDDDGTVIQRGFAEL
jgi:hypothetical protein